MSIEKKKKKTEDGENVFFKALDNTFWLTSKGNSGFNRVVHRQPAIKGSSWKGKWYVAKSRLDVEFV